MLALDKPRSTSYYRRLSGLRVVQLSAVSVRLISYFWNQSHLFKSGVKSMLRRIGSFTLCALALVCFQRSAHWRSLTLRRRRMRLSRLAAAPVVESDRIRDGLVGPVRRVRTEVAKLSNESGKLQEGKHAVLEVVAYDIKGNKIENQYFPIAGANLTGKEVYKYDDKGNISEMTLLNADGSLLSKEVYKYEFDFAGNWNKMTTAVAVIEGGKIVFRADRSHLSLDHVLPRREHDEDGPARRADVRSLAHCTGTCKHTPQQ